MNELIELKRRLLICYDDESNGNVAHTLILICSTIQGMVDDQEQEALKRIKQEQVQEQSNHEGQR